MATSVGVGAFHPESTQRVSEGCGPADKITVVLKTAVESITELGVYGLEQRLKPEQMSGESQLR